MLKNLFLNTSAIRYAPDAEGNKTAAELEREQIEVEELPPSKTKKGEDGYVEPTSDSEDDNEREEEADEENNEEADETDDEEEEVVAETAEAKAIREAEEAASSTNKTQRQIARMQKRIDTLTADKTRTVTETAELRRLLDAKKEDGTLTLTEEEVERRAELKAEEKVAERVFRKAVDTLAAGARKLDPDSFNKNINSVTSEIGLLPPIMIAILEDLENDAGKKVGAEVLVHLSKNIDDYEDAYSLPEGRMALKLQKLANKITKKEPRAISRVPAPNEPVGGNSAKIVLNDKMTDEEWISKREAATKGGIRAR